MRALRASAAILLVTQALLVMHPVLLVSNAFSGAGILGKALFYVRIGDVVAQGIGYLVIPTVVVLLLLAAWGVATSTRGIGALMLQPAVLAMILVPFLRPLLWVRPEVLLIVSVAAIGALLAIAGHSSATAAKRRRWWLLGIYAAAVTGLVIANGMSQAFPIMPLDRVAVAGTGSASTADDLPRAKVPQNPSMAANPFNSIHNDTWATDSYNLPAPRPGGQVDTLFTGGDCATITFDSQGRLITLCSTLTRVVGYIVDPNTLQVLVRRVVGERSPSLTDFSGGGYFVLDDKDRVVFPARGGVLRVLSPVDLRELSRVDVSPTLQPGEQVTSVLPDWQGRYWYVGSLGTVGVVQQDGPKAVNLQGEDIENSFAVAEDGVYVVTGAALYKLQAQSTGPPDQQWRTEYDRGAQRKPGQTSRASGTTPTLFSDWGVAITDNASPRMNVVVADRRTGQIVCQQPVFGEQAGATENSLIGIDDTLIVENNYGYAPAISSTMAGRTTVPGMAAIKAVDGECEPLWSNDSIHVPSLVSKATTRSGLVLTYTKPANTSGVDAWYFTGVDVRTGEQVWTRLAGTGVSFNNHYAAAYLGPDGDMFVGTLSGIAVLRS